MIGKIDVSHVLGIRPRDTMEEVDALYEAWSVEQKDRNGLRGYAHGNLYVAYDNGRAAGITISKYIDQQWQLPRSRTDNDPIFNLYGRSEAEVVAMLGPPSSRDAVTWGDSTLCWYFPDSDVKLNAKRWPTQKAVVATFVTLLGSNKPSHVSDLRVLW